MPGPRRRAAGRSAAAPTPPRACPRARGRRGHRARTRAASPRPAVAPGSTRARSAGARPPAGPRRGCTASTPASGRASPAGRNAPSARSGEPLDEPLDALARLFDPVVRGGIAGAHVARATLAEGGAGHDHDLLLAEQSLGEGLVVEARAADARAAVERAARLEAGQAHVVEPPP